MRPSFAPLRLPRILLASASGLLSLAVGPLARAQAPQAYQWSVQYLIDNSQSVFGRSMKVFPRANRALAVSPDGNFLYAGYHQSFNGTGEVRKIDIRVPDYEDATVAVLPGCRAKAIAVDDRNHVYIADGEAIDVYDGDLQSRQFQVRMENCDGVAVTRERGDLVLYATERDKGQLRRFLVESRMGGALGGATPAGLGGNGVLQITGARSLRGVAVDRHGRIWMADVDGSRVFRVNPDGTGLTSVEVGHPIAIAFYGDTALVARHFDRQIALISPDLVVTGNLSVPWEELELSPFGNNRDGALSGIAVIPGGKGFFVANEHGQTANEKSTYGRKDDNSGYVDHRFYKDTFEDDNEPILRAVPVPVQPAASPVPQ